MPFRNIAYSDRNFSCNFLRFHSPTGSIVKKKVQHPFLSARPKAKGRCVCGFIHHTSNHFYAKGICQEYSTMSRPKFPNKKTNGAEAPASAASAPTPKANGGAAETARVAASPDPNHEVRKMEMKTAAG